MYNDSLFNAFARSFEARSETDMSMAEYLESCRGDPMRYANAAERLLAAIGEPQMIDTAKDPRLGRIFLNRTMRAYPAFAGFHGMEETIERIGRLLPARRARSRRAQADSLSAGAGGRRQVVARRAAEVADGSPSDLCAEGRRRLSPVFESPLSLFDPDSLGADDRGKIRHSAPPPQRADESVVLQAARGIRGDISRFRVAKIQAFAVATDCDRENRAGDENNQDISSLVGKVDIRKLETFAQNDPDAYSYSGRLEPRQPGRSRIRRNVQGADQDAASAADGRPRKATISAPRISGRSPLPGSFWRIRTNPNGRASRPTRTTKPSSTASA